VFLHVTARLLRTGTDATRTSKQLTTHATTRISPQLRCRQTTHNICFSFNSIGMSSLSIPTTSALSSTQLVPSTHPAVYKILQRLSRPSLLSLVLDWLDERNQENLAPYLADPENEDDDDQDLYPPAPSLAALREIYTELQTRKGSKRDVVDRIIEGDWRDGITLYQLAMADMQYLYDHPASQKWTALKIVRMAEDELSSKPTAIPRFHPSTFLRNLQKEVLPDVKAHYNLDRHSTLHLTILRVFIIESPYNSSAALHTQKQHTTFDASKTFYIAFPDASPYVYVSLTTTTSTPGQPSSMSDNKSLRKLTLDGIPKAFSKPRERYRLESTSLSARNLEALVDRRGPNGTNAAGGGWGVYTEEKKDGRENPLNNQLSTPEASLLESDDEGKETKQLGLKRQREEDEKVVKRRKLVAKGRFGNSAKFDDGKGIERLDVRIEDLYSLTRAVGEDDEVDEISGEGVADKKKKKGRRSTISIELERDEAEAVGEGWRPDIHLTFHGNHIFAGIRELVEAGVIDGEKMPGWMTGEEGVSVGVVRDGRIKGNKGSGL
jgi:central kinetochore subunit Mis15/CHL4